MNSTSKQNGIFVTVLGSGTCVPSLFRGSCAVLMEVGNNKLLFDMGAGTMRRLLETGTTINQITHIFLSHFHPDHSAELVPYLFASKYGGGIRRTTPLTLVAGRGMTTFFRHLETAYGNWIDLGRGMFEIHEMDTTTTDRLELGAFTADSAPMNHNPESLAYRITAPSGASVVYSGDTDTCEHLVDLATETDLLICESAFPDELKSKGHLTPMHAGDMATRARARKLVLTHFYPECDQIDIKAQCRKTWQGPLVLAEDLMKIRVKR